MIHSWLSKHGDYYTTSHPYSTRCLKLAFSQIVLLWRQRIQDLPHMHGGAFSKVEMSYKGVLDGKLEMGNP